MSTTTHKGSTWLDPEDYAYPEGSLRQSRRHARVRCSDGAIRMALIGIPDTFFSIPGRIRVRGKTVTGYVTCDSAINEFTFVSYTYGKNEGLLK